MKNYFSGLCRIFLLSICLMFFSALLFSFKAPKSRQDTISGFWITENQGASGTPFLLKIFKERHFYNMVSINGQNVITHKGTYKILDGKRYQEDISASLPNSAWSEMKGKSFVVTYDLSEDKQHLVLTGINDPQNRSDTTRWIEYYKKVWEP